MLIDQSPHPVIPVIEDDLLLHLPPEESAGLVAEREDAIRRERADPHRYGYEPPNWRLVDLHVCEMRLASPLAVLEVLIMGGIRSAKTEFAAKRMVQHLFYYQNAMPVNDFIAWIWCLHENERSSETVGQSRIYRYFPAEMKRESGKEKKNRTTKLAYTEGYGFTGESFIWANRLCDFKMYGAQDSTLQGSALTSAWSDELVPKNVVATVKERLNTRAMETGTVQHKLAMAQCLRVLQAGGALTAAQAALLYLGVHIITFTPKEGYSSTVADFLDGSRTLLECDAELLPRFGPGQDPKLIGYEQVPQAKACRQATRRVFYFHTKDNAYGNWEGLKIDLAGAKPDYVRIAAYGDVRKAWASKFPKFRDTVHVLPRERIPRTGTWYHRCDPCDTRNWFMTWWLVSGTRHYCVRQWPQAGDYIPGVGDPGAWAVASERGKFDGDPGPAQESFGFGLRDYQKEIERVETELATWFYANAAPDKPPPAMITIAERHMDSRFGNTPTPKQDESTTLIEECADMGLYFEPAPGEHLVEGIALINDALAYDDTKPIDSLNCPHFFAAAECEGVIYFLQNWTGKDGQKGACKDPGDNCRYHFLADATDLTGIPKMLRKARGHS